MNLFEERIEPITGEGLYSESINVFQVNLGLRCNQVCAHCHVDASPERTEVMEWPFMEKVLEAARSVQPDYVDLTGGAPELNPHFKRFVQSLCREGHLVQVRTNLSVLMEPECDGLMEFLKDHEVQLVGSMPCYLEENVRAQRGSGAYEKSVEAARLLNDLGYGKDPKLRLNLVYNPGGAFLPPEQSKLEVDYKRELKHRFGIEFSKLLTITNMPLGRFWNELRRTKEDQKYLSLLKESFNPGTLNSLMCRYQVSIGWDGNVYDCDFNLALEMPVDHGAPSRIEQFEKSVLEKRRIVTGEHCFGCTAGCGSSCAGALV